jgi:integrase
VSYAWHGQKPGKREQSKSNSERHTFGSIRVNVYTNPDNGACIFSATVAGKRYRIARGQHTGAGRGREIRSAHCQEQAERSVEFSQKKLEYYAAPETRLSGTPLDVAVDFYLAHQDEKLVKKKVPELLKAFLAEVQPTHSRRYYDGLHDDLDKFAGVFPGFISDITTAQITGWLESRKVGPKRWNNLRGSLGRLWKFAQQHNAILRKEKTVLDWVPTKKLKATSREIYTPDEMKKLLKACDREMLPIFALGGFAGIRSAELTVVNTEYRGLEWEKHILWDKNVIIVPGQEITNEDGEREVLHQRLVPLLPNLRAWLEPYRNEKGLLWKLKHIQHRMDKLQEDSGVRLKHNALRHSFCTYRASTEKDLAKVALEAGNSVTMLQQHYVRVQLEEVGRAWFAIMPK